MPFKGSTSAFWGGYKYFGASPKVRAAYRQAHKDREYTRIYFDLFGAWGPKEDYFANPKKFLPFLQECAADGLGPVIWMGPEDDKKAQQTYGKQGWGAYISQLKKFIPLVDPCVAEYILGVEVEEYWSDATVAKIGSALRKLITKPIWVHRKTGQHGEWSWWKDQSWATGLAYQFNKRDNQGWKGFLAHPDDVEEETSIYASRLKTHGGGKKFLANEYAFKRPEAKAQQLGEVALAHGAVGFSNGGPKVK